MKSAMKTFELDTRRITAHLTAGLMAGIVSRTATAPLDRIKVISQISGKNMLPIEGVKMMLAEGGIWSMWRGNFSNVLKVGPEISIKFLAYNEIKNFLSPDMNQDPTTRQRMVAGFWAGAISRSVIHPLEVCKTRLVLRKTGEEGRLLHMAAQGYQRAGYRFFLKGFKSSIIGVAMFACIDFSTYEKLKTFVSAPKNHFPSVGGVLLAGMCSSLIGIITCFPIGLVGVNLMASDDQIKFSDLVTFIKKRGIVGMYCGLTAALIKGVPTYALSYVTYEHVIRYMGHTMV